MPDFGSLFNVNPSLSPTAPATSIEAPVAAASTLSNPDFIRMLAMIGGKLGAGMSGPGTFGRAAGEVATMMAQGGATNKGMGTASTSVPVPVPVPVAPVSPTNNPLDAAKHIKSYGKLVEDAFKIDPTLKPTGFDGAFNSALTTTPPPVSTDETGVSAPAAPTSASPIKGPGYVSPSDIATVAAPVAVSSAQPLSDMGAMTIGPEGVGNIFTQRNAAAAQNIASGTLDLARQKQATEDIMAPVHKAYLEATTRHINSDVAFNEWKNSDIGRKTIQENALALAGEPSRAAAAADEIKTRFALDQVSLLPPAVRNAKVAGTNYTMEQFMRLGILSPHGISALASMEDAKVKADIARKNNQAIIDERSERKEASVVDVAIKQIATIDAQINSLVKKQSAEELAGDPAALSLAKAYGNLRSADTDKQIKNLQKQKMMLSKKIPGWVYSEVPTTVEEEKIPVVKRGDLGKHIKDLRRPSFNSPNIPFPSNPSSLFNPGGSL